jgi:hypothetical protein
MGCRLFLIECDAGSPLGARIIPTQAYGTDMGRRIAFARPIVPCSPHEIDEIKEFFQLWLSFAKEW